MRKPRKFCRLKKETEGKYASMKNQAELSKRKLSRVTALLEGMNVKGLKAITAGNFSG